ncbi:MAG: PDZ domain-containing protein [Candidatus Korarchaeota archaeon]|nr:PDZ domain-containing protein [Candidatus Korarchaeota archaeon]NIU84635.1 PDZ domain-containing protein [Candidatus Thorarchaeota archaeon]NIW14661.1 PDZ domain-containing protein [Candidatus Thorarchaeota archaeon]NIW52737.1 PDZ domain-containing protein [Candidatus Korarchaeota archaeon]
MTLTNIESLVEKVAPSIVSIYTIKLQRSVFLQPVPIKGAGSGFIVDERGYILTNHHVLQGMEQAKMVIPSLEKEIAGKVMGRDPENDLALIKSGAPNLQALEFADSSKLKAGRHVIALGNALGLKGAPTVSHGIISAPSRTIRSKQKIFEDLIQTDAAINPGNSGGPLVDMNGKVVGVNTAMVPMAQGMAFAIPANIAKRVVDQIIQYGEVRRPWLGVSLMNMSPQLARRLGTGVKRGALVVNTAMRSSAAKAGIRKGDIIQEIDNVEVHSSREVQDVIASQSVGEKVEITATRNGRTHKHSVTLEGRPQE